MINSMILQGRLTKDPEIRRTTNGTAVASFTLAWSEKYKETERKLFLPCVAWGGTAEFVCRYFKKGSALAVDGKLSTRQWQDKDGNNRSCIELTVSEAHFTEGKTPLGSFDPMDDEDMPF